MTRYEIVLAKMYTKVLLFFLINIVSTLCLIPNLNVREIDKKLIDRKRQDTMDMCKIFNAENKKLQEENQRLKDENSQLVKRFKRTKRDVEMVDPDMTLGDPSQLQHVEDIVEKLYDEMDTNYTRLKKPAPVKNATKAGRRFDFAPAILAVDLEPSKVSYDHDDTSTVPGIKWPKKWKHGIVPYFTDPNTYDSQLSDTIDKAFDYFEKATCIRLQKLHQKPVDKESMSEVEWIYITNPAGIRQCVHSNEHKENKGVQIVVLGYDCMATGQIVHEVMHQLGFSHEHTRPDRDQFITVMWDNIKPGYKKYFQVRSEDSFPNIPYDYSSILHYPAKAFSKNGQITISIKPDLKLGQREGLSEGDVAKIGIIFGKECVERNRQYLLSTCPSVVKGQIAATNVPPSDIEDYFKDRLWPYGVVNYMIKDKLEFSVEERENIEAVINHIERETCIQFRDATPSDDDKNEKGEKRTNPPTHSVEADYDASDIDFGNRSTAAWIPYPYPIGSTGDAIIADDATVADDAVAADPVIETDADDLTGNETVDENAAADDKDLRTGKSHNKIKRVKRQASRKHADSILVLTRSSATECKCPTPGRPKGDQVLQINSDCFNSVNTLLHLFVHVLGLDHQHNMHDRNSYLHLDWKNMSPEISEDMKTVLPPAASAGFPYDYQSVMHYPWLQIKNGAKSIMYPIWNDGWSMGHWQGLSSIDVQKLDSLYNIQCSARKKQEGEQTEDHH